MASKVLPSRSKTVGLDNLRTPKKSLSRGRTTKFELSDFGVDDDERPVACGGFLALFKKTKRTSHTPRASIDLGDVKACRVGDTNSECGTSFGGGSPSRVEAARKPEGSPHGSVMSSLSFTTCFDGISPRGADSISTGDESVEVSECKPCACGLEFHYKGFNPEYPLRTAANIKPGSYEESLKIVGALTGYWVTVLERSEPLDTHLKFMGLNMMKRAVMNRLAVPMSVFLEPGNQDVMKSLLYTPLGVRSMTCHINGGSTIDDDPDCGQWEGGSVVADFKLPWFCSDSTVRVIQQTRVNQKIGKMVESRVVVPDQGEGKIMFYNMTLTPKSDPKKSYSCDRILKYVGPPKFE